MVKKIPNIDLFGRVLVPPSKSDSQRAILAAALSKGESQLYNLGTCSDELSMLENIRKLGANVEMSGGQAQIEGLENFPERCELNPKESGLGLRLLAALCSVHDGVHVLKGEGSALNRPQGFFESHLRNLGAGIESNNGYLPLRISGKISGGKIHVDGSMSSQFLSGLLMALPLLDNDSELIVTNLKSTPYVKMTLDTLQAFGIDVQNDSMEHFYIKGGQSYRPTKYAIEGDWSAASFWLVAAALNHKIKLVGLSMETNQADYAVLDALVGANCTITVDESGIAVDGSNLKPFAFDATHCPDLFPALVALAVNIDGNTIISGVERLKHKESNRGNALVKEFGKLGAHMTIEGNNMIIEGGHSLKTAVVNSHNDHRIAMSLAIAGTKIESGLQIEEAESVAKSYPNFWKDFEGLASVDLKK